MTGKPTRFAAIDLGTNSVRLIVAETVEGDGYRLLDDERQQTRLGLRLQETGRIAPECAAATLEALERMKAVADGFGVRELRAVATAAVREADNGGEVVAAALERCGLVLEMISPEEEADLALRSVRRHFSPDHYPAAVVDIGGGSMEIVFTEAGLADGLHSLPLGAVRLTDRFVRSDPISVADWQALCAGIDRELEDVIGRAPFATPTIIGSGGTFTTVASMALLEHHAEPAAVQGHAMTPAELDAQLLRLREAPLEARRSMPGLSPERADIILAGAAAVSRLAARLAADRILVNDRGVREGLLLEMMSRVSPSRREGHAADDA